MSWMLTGVLTEAERRISEFLGPLIIFRLGRGSPGAGGGHSVRFFEIGTPQTVRSR